MKPLELTAGGIATMACLLEVAAPKPGNVHRGADFEDATLVDFMTSAVILGQTIDQLNERPVGYTIRAVIEATRLATGTNTNLGMVLLLVPLAKATTNNAGIIDRHGVGQVLRALDTADADDVFAAIRFAKPAGLGTVAEMDVRQADSASDYDLVAAMSLAQDRDLVARQYTNGFAEVFDCGVPWLVEGRSRFRNLTDAIVFSHVSFMANFPDSLIARKCGEQTAAHSQMLAAKALAEINFEATRREKDPGKMPHALERFWQCIGELDFWLRSDGHRRNPGTSADLVAASLYVAIQSRKLKIEP